MKKNTGNDGKRLAALVLAAGMTMGGAFTAFASSATPSETSSPVFETKTADINTSEKTQTQEGEVWASVTDEPLKQLKVTLPIRLDFVIYRDSTKGGATEFLCGDYSIEVDGNSEVGVKLDNIQIKRVVPTKWNLVSKSDVASLPLDEAESIKSVALNIAGTDLALGTNPVADFTVGIGNNEALGMSGTVAQVTKNIKAQSAEKAFIVTYTISQNTPTT